MLPSTIVNRVPAVGLVDQYRLRQKECCLLNSLRQRFEGIKVLIRGSVKGHTMGYHGKVDSSLIQLQCNCRLISLILSEMELIGRWRCGSNKRGKVSL